MKKVRVRYAPSPTGYQHIGGVRTALFNYLFARSQGGDFILRIEDTDQTRYFDGALQDIFDTFEWLGITYDEGPVKGGPYEPYFQSKRIDLYQNHAEQLIEQDKAYYCYCSSDRLQQVRDEQKANGQPTGYDRRCRDLSDEEQSTLRKENSSPVVRFKAPLQGLTAFDDQILGHIEIENKQLQDFVLLKSDGFPTYHLANIVDDHLMEISHVLRSQEWIPTTPMHVLLYTAFGWEPPQFCHLPMVMGPGGGKLSKRHGATQLLEFKKNGFVPDAIVNFISLLGWAFDDKQEMFTLKDLEKVFSLEKINKASAVFNYEKLNWFNGVYIREMDPERLLDMLLPLYQEDGLVSADPDDDEVAYLTRVIELIRERIEKLTDAPDMSPFMFGSQCEYKTWEKILPKKVEPATVIAILKDAIPVIQDNFDLPDDDLKNKLYELTEKHGVKAGAVFMPVRIAITGTNQSPDLIPVLKTLGKELVLQRLQTAVDKLQSEM